jgi:hypothetical protein
MDLFENYNSAKQRYGISLMLQEGKSRKDIVNTRHV